MKNQNYFIFPYLEKELFINKTAITLDIVEAGNNGNIESGISFKEDLPLKIYNGQFGFISKSIEDERELKRILTYDNLQLNDDNIHYSVSEDTDFFSDLYLISNPELNYNEDLKLSEYYNKNNQPIRAYKLTKGDIFTVDYYLENEIDENDLSTLKGLKNNIFTMYSNYANPFIWIARANLTQNQLKERFKNDDSSLFNFREFRVLEISYIGNKLSLTLSVVDLSRYEHIKEEIVVPEPETEVTEEVPEKQIKEPTEDVGA